MMSTPTPGPWWHDGLVVSALTGRVADCDQDGPEDQRDANARLIAAAPDLLAALEQLLAIVARGSAWTLAARAVVDAARGAPDARSLLGPLGSAPARLCALGGRAGVVHAGAADGGGCLRGQFDRL